MLLIPARVAGLPREWWNNENPANSREETTEYQHGFCEPADVRAVVSLFCSARECSPSTSTCKLDFSPGPLPGGEWHSGDPVWGLRTECRRMWPLTLSFAGLHVSSWPPSVAIPRGETLRGWSFCPALGSLIFLLRWPPQGVSAKPITSLQ